MGTFNPQILVDKLTKLNSTQASIETLSHWCIFHMYKAKQVVETWSKQFHCAPREQRLAFLYLANDILQNSRRKGSDYVGEFWKVLPDALRDVIQNGDESGRASAMRLVNIWEERKVFGSRGQILKEELLGRNVESGNRNGKDSGLKLRHNAGNALDKIVTGYQIVYAGPMDDETVLSKCRNTMGFFDKVEKEIDGNSNSEKFRDSAFTEELRGQNAMLSSCIDQLTSVESSRARLVSNLREALQEQEFKLSQVRNQLQAARTRSEQANKLCHQFLNGDSNNVQLSVDQSLKDAQTYNSPADKEQSAPVMYTRQVGSLPDNSASEEDSRKSAAAEVAAKLTASTSSAQMLSYVLSSLASEGVIGHQGVDSPAEKRQKVEAADHQSTSASSSPYIPPLPPNNPQQPPPPPVDNPSAPPPPTSPPPMPPLPPMPSYPLLPPPSYMVLSGPTNGMPYYGMNQLQTPLPPPSLSSYTPISGGLPPFTAQPPPASSYPGFPGSDGSFYSQPPSVPMAPVSRQ